MIHPSAACSIAACCLIVLCSAGCGDDSSPGDTTSDVGTSDLGDTSEPSDTDAAADTGDAATNTDTTEPIDTAEPDVLADVATDSALDSSGDTLVDAGADTNVVDNDEDGVPAELDCDDNDQTVVATNVDADGDGFTGCDGDCCDSADACVAPALVNPAAIERATADDAVAIDDDCDGTVDEPETLCDTGIALDEANATTAAQALELCSTSTGVLPGLVAASWVRADGSAATHSTQYGVSGRFGDTIVPRGGERMIVLSTGRAHDRSQPGFCGSVTCEGVGMGNWPDGGPFEVPGCPTATSLYDDAGLALTLRAPSNATGFRVDVKYLTQDFPESVCTDFTDQAIVLMSPTPTGFVYGNIAFDSTGVPLSGNFRPTDVCEGCALGEDELTGTGFDVPSDGSATVWLRVQAPVDPGSTFTLRFAIWDSSDQNFDSTLLIDNFAWNFEPTPFVSTTAAP